MRKIILFTCIVCLCSPLVAKEKGGVEIANVRMERMGDEVLVQFLVVSVKKSTNRNYKLTLTPVIYNASMQTALPPVIFESRRARILDKRNDVEINPDAIVAKVGDVVDYQASIPYQKQMAWSSLRVDLKAEGCCNEYLLPPLLLANEVKLAIDPIPVYTVNPHYSYITPAIELDKVRREGGAQLYFPVGSSRLMSGFKDNRAELAKINQSIRSIVDNKADETLRGITLHGTCSPEGSWALNTRLAQQRAQAVESYLKSRYGYPNTIFTINTLPEDWPGLKVLVTTSDVPDKEELLRIIDSDVSPDTKDRQIAQLNKGIPYRYLLATCYPQLRKVGYTVDYTVKPFTVAEGKEMLRTKPKNLSLNELFEIAKSYGEGTPQFDSLLITAAELFSESTPANINAATTALKQGNLTAAKHYLQKVDAATAPPQYDNTMGLLLLLEGDYQRAGSFFDKAAQQGLRAAAQNTVELNKKIENAIQIKNQPVY